MESTPTLNACAAQSILQTRGWTFQESATPTSLLYFTEFGVYFRKRAGDTSSIVAEGSAKPDLQFMDGSDDYHYVRLVEPYTKRRLTYPSDILRAFAGVLYGIYGSHTVFGMPWRAFDRAILWEASNFSSKQRHNFVGNIFPSWSWASTTGPVHFHEQSLRGCSVALWAMMSEKNEASSMIIIAVPSQK